MKKVYADMERFERGDFWVDIKISHDEYEAWITKKNYGISTLMFGMPKEQQSFNEFVDIVEGNIDDYIEDYEYEYDEDYED